MVDNTAPATSAARRARGRGSMLSALQPEERPPLKAADGTVDYFKLRVAAQQFMNDNGPLFAAFARAADAPGGLIERGSLSQAISAATALAQRVARTFSGKADPAAHEVRPFRHAAAEIVAQAWTDGGLVSFDADAVAEQHAAAFRIVDEDLDRSAFKELDISDEASIAMTAASVTFVLMRPVMVYDFRRDRALLVSTLSSAVLAMATEASAQVLPENAKPADRRSVLQTAANRLAELMCSVYERRARQVVAHLSAMPEAEKEAFTRRYDPLPELTRTFQEWGVVFAATTLAFARSAAQAAQGRAPDGASPRS